MLNDLLPLNDRWQTWNIYFNSIITLLLLSLPLFLFLYSRMCVQIFYLPSNKFLYSWFFLLFISFHFVFFAIKEFFVCIFIIISICTYTHARTPARLICAYVIPVIHGSLTFCTGNGFVSHS